MKRYYIKTILNNDEFYPSLKLNPRKLRAHALVKKHIDQRFMEITQDESLLRSLANYLKLIICPLQFNKSQGAINFLKKKRIYDSAVRNFSKKSLTSLLDEPLYCALFTNFYESGDF